VTQAPGASLQGEDADCGGVAAAHYGGVRTPRPARPPRQRSEALQTVFRIEDQGEMPPKSDKF